MDGLAAALVGDPGTTVTGGLDGLRFWKMTGSGNDFVFFDARAGIDPSIESALVIGALCDRRRGVGADGIVLLESDAEALYGIRYFNRDGSLAEFCGNASLCSVRLAARLRVVTPGAPFRFRTSSGVIPGLFGGDGPQVGMPPVADLDPAFGTGLEPGEVRIGFARVGVPHLVVEVTDPGQVDVVRRGRALRRLQSLPAGANVNFVGRRRDGQWSYRTYERGVEDETLACGSGSVATAALLTAWHGLPSQIRLVTRSGAPLTVAFTEGQPLLSGEGRLVFEGLIGDIKPPT